MNGSTSTVSPTKQARKALFLSCLMLFSTTLAILSSPVVGAHNTESSTIWAKEGSVDSGWVQLNATGANAVNGTPAMFDWTMEFAPGAILENLSFEVRVDGGSGVEIQEPMIIAPNSGQVMFDWRNNGWLGQTNGFDGNNPHQGRLSPNADVGATFTLPSGTEITDLILEALAPADPYTSLTPVELYIRESAVHPIDGMLYLAVGDYIIILDAKANPTIIDLFQIKDSDGGNWVTDLEIDVANNRMLMTTEYGDLLSADLTDSSWNANLPAEPSGNSFDQIHIASNGDLFAFSEEGIFTLNSAGTGWTLELASGTSNWPEGTPWATLEHNGIIYSALLGGGVGRWDLATMSALTPWSTANNLHSDYISSFLVSGNQLLISSFDAGVARRDVNGNFWLATWNDGNWLTSNDVKGMTLVGNQIDILTSIAVHSYNTNTGSFTATTTLSSLGQVEEGQNIIHWPSGGERAPSQDQVLVTDAMAVFAVLEPGNTPFYAGDLVIGSGPRTADMTDALQHNGIVYVGSGEWLDRYSMSQSRWLAPIATGDEISRIVTNGVDVFVGTYGSGIHVVDSNGTVTATYDTLYGLASDDISDLDADGDWIVATHPQDGVSAFNQSNFGIVTTLNEQNSDLDEDAPTGVAIHSGIAYIGTAEDGLNRYILENDTFLGSWISTGINDVDFAPVAIVGTGSSAVLHMGLPGFGVVRKDLTTGEILVPLTEEPDRGNPGPTEILPSNQVFALEADGGDLFIGTSDSGIIWDGNSVTDLSEGNSWQTQPQQIFDFVLDGNDLYAGTNIGVCKYTASSGQIMDCQNVYDGMPNWGTYTVGVNSTTVFGGTNSGVGLIDKSSFTVSGTWEAGEVTENAPVEVIGNIAYIGLNNIGIARYDIQNSEWLTTWTEDNVLDAGNGDVTSLVADIRPNYLWVGGADGLQLINVTSGTEAYDIEKSSNLYGGNGDPHDMVIYGNILYYHEEFSSDNLYRIDVANFNALSSIDVGQQLDENGGDIYGLELIGDVIHVSVASGQWWNTEGSGGIGLYNATTGSWMAELLPEGSVDRVTSFVSSTDHTWVSWGESKLQVFAPNQTLAGEWDDLDFPIREIIEFDGNIMFATTEGVARFDESTFQWLSMWTPGSGLPSGAEDAVYELWTNGTDLVVGTAANQGWQGISGEISHLDPNGNWDSWSTGGANNIPSGYPIAMVMCGGLLNVALWANNGGVARIDLENGTVEASFTSQRLDDGSAAAVACDGNDILYVGYYDDEQPISRYDYNTGGWLSSIDTANHNLPSDPLWWGAMEFAGGKLAIGYDIGDEGDNVIGGGYALITINGASVGQASILSTGSPVSSIDWLGNQWLIGQAGGTSGYSHVDTLSQLGQNTLYSLPSLVSGQVTSMEGNSTHIWAASASYTNSGSGLLQGIRLANGSVEWQRGWTIPANAAVTDLQLVGTDLYMSTNNRGIRMLDTITGTFQPMPTGLHDFQDGIKRVGDDLFIGLQGTSSSSAGIQVFNTTQGAYSAGRLLAGLPSNNINGFLSTSSGGNIPGQGVDMVYIATDTGVGRWNSTANTWETALTALDGLPTPNVEDLIQDWNDNIWMATPNGVSMYNVTTDSFTTYTRNDGLMGTSAWSFAWSQQSTQQPDLFIAHDGRGTDRPGVTQFDATTQTVIAQHQFDQLPSNSVTAVATDYWGVHIATDVGPMVHWNAGSGDFESGINVFTMKEWPVSSMRSDGTHLIAIGENGATIVQSTTSSHAKIAEFSAIGSTGGSVVTGSYVWISTSDGLRGWNINTGDEVPQGNLRRANPLSIGLSSTFTDVTNYTHPGMQFALVDAANAVMVSELGSPDGPHGVMMQGVPLVLSSPVSGAATWAKLIDMKWNATLNISDDPALITSMQFAVDNGPLINGTRYMTLRLQSPSNGSMWIKMSYDWFRTETPIEGLSLWDRPEDGGGALLANWSLVHDDDFSSYLIYLNEGPWASQPTVADLQPFAADAAVSLHSRLQTEITSIGGQPLQDGVEYWAVVVVEYNDGRFGTPSTPFGPATPTDEVPMPPMWATGAPHEGGQDGDLAVEWARCTALDLASTRIYASTTLVTDVLGLTVNTEVPPQEGNSTVIVLDSGTPHWLGLTCVDEAGQEDMMNATIIGPVVPTGGVDDGIPPSKLTGFWAEDVPQDDGGRVQAGWNNPTADDCAFVTVYMKPVTGTANQLPTNVDGFSVAGIVPDCETNMTILDSIGDFPLTDGQTYHIGAVASDKWLNQDTGDVTILEVTPYVNNLDGSTIPERITTINAWDRPDDDGTAIDISWVPSDADDFDYYVVWVSEHPLDDLSEFWQLAGYEPGICGCIVMNKQWIDSEQSPLELQINTALYGGDNLLSALPGQIIPDTELFVTVTVHDIKGNVYLDGLNTATVTPIDNLADQTPPERLSMLSLVDRPADDGTAVLLDFELSDASDIESYEVYAAAFSFDSVGVNGNGPSDPIAVLNRDAALPLLIEALAFDTLVIPNLPVTVAVVAVDSSGNAHRDNLITATAISVDDGFDDIGEYLPDINGITLEWIGDSILVTWDHSNDPSVRSYVVFISDQSFSNVNQATMIGEVSVVNSLVISPSEFLELSNESSWWIGVSAKDDTLYREKIDSVMIAPFNSDIVEESEDDTTAPSEFGELLNSGNLLAICLGLIAILLLVLVVRSRGSSKSRDKEWELQEATWGIQARSGWDEPSMIPSGKPPVEAPPGIRPGQQNDIYAAAQRIEDQSPSQPAPQRWSQPAQQQPPAQGGIDTSFLDDLL